MTSIKNFILDYCKRHAHPINAILHILGVPAVFIGLYLLFRDQVILGCLLFVLGYFLQYLGHRAQGNEVGEVTLIKKIWCTLVTASHRSKQARMVREAQPADRLHEIKR